MIHIPDWPVLSTVWYSPRNADSSTNPETQPQQQNLMWTALITAVYSMFTTSMVPNKDGTFRNVVHNYKLTLFLFNNSTSVELS